MKKELAEAEADEIFPRNNLAQVVCELRFPVILDLMESLPHGFQKDLRNSFPHYNRNWVLEFEPGAVDATREPRYEFLTRDKQWKVSLRPTAISLETLNYQSFSEFQGSLEAMFDAAKTNLDLLFFTRVGLRYINKIPAVDDSTDWTHWINPRLLAPLQLEQFGSPSRFWQELNGTVHNATSYYLRHGYGVSDRAEYIIDIDISLEGVEINSALDEITKFRSIAKRIFVASITEHTLAWLRGQAS